LLFMCVPTTVFSPLSLHDALPIFSRGVKQANFHVLRTNASPAVLVELGFISNQEEGTFLATEYGKQQMTQSLYNAFAKFKKEFEDRKSTRLNSSHVKISYAVFCLK